MLAPDVNVLVDGFREDSPHHRATALWLRGLIASPAPFALFEPVLAGFLRVVTHPRVFDPPAPWSRARAFVRALSGQSNAVLLRPGRGHFEIFLGLCGQVAARGNLVADAYLAAMAIEHGCTWVSRDRDFARFSGLDWRPPE